MYQICFANMLQIHISDTIMYTLAEMNVSNMYYIFDTKLTFLVVYVVHYSHGYTIVVWTHMVTLLRCAASSICRCAARDPHSAKS